MKIYLAGKIGHTDWRHQIVPDLKEIGESNSWHEVVELPTISPSWMCTGPFFVGCDHGCAHGQSGHAVNTCMSYNGFYVSAKDIFQKCLLGIHRSDVFFCYLGPDAGTAYGTLFKPRGGPGTAEKDRHRQAP